MPNEVTIATVVSQLATVFSVDMTDDLVEAYYVALSDIDSSLVKVAADELLKDAQFMPRPAELRRAAKRIQAESSSQPAEPAHWRKSKYKCLDCRDTGWITVWHPRAQAAAVAYLANHLPEDKFRRNLYEAAAKCRCQAGQDRPGDVATYNPDIHVPIRVAGHGERVKALLEAVKNMKPSNHISEFDEWSGT